MPCLEQRYINSKWNHPVEVLATTEVTLPGLLGWQSLAAKLTPLVRELRVWINILHLIQLSLAHFFSCTVSSRLFYEFRIAINPSKRSRLETLPIEISYSIINLLRPLEVKALSRATKRLREA